MKELVAFIAEHIVDNVEDIEIEEDVVDSEINLTLKVNPDDMGKVIGKQGKTANSIRSILKACAIKEEKKVTLNIESI